MRNAKQVDWGGQPELLRNGHQGIDPFSFVYSLAQKSTKNQRPTVYSSVTKCFGLTSSLPDPSNEDCYFFPTPMPRSAACFNDRRTGDFRPELLWKLFRQVVGDEPQIDPTIFREILGIPGTKLVKLTQTLFLINPDYFVSADVLSDVPANADMDMKSRDFDDYKSAMRKAQQTFPGCRPYELNLFLYLQFRSKSPLLTGESRFFQLSTNAYGKDCWEDFDRSHAVYTDSFGAGRAAGSWHDTARGSDRGDSPDPLTEPSRGDVILVRAGVNNGRAIGVVHRNDYSEPDGLNELSRIHVYWINKSRADFVPGNRPGGAETTRVAFSETTPGLYTYEAFRDALPYQPTFALIDKLTSSKGNGPPSTHPPQPPTSSIHPLNQILYGPPGTGKTWHTATRAVAIVEGRHVREVEQEDRASIKRRFDMHRGAGRIEMVTFHQNTTYEDFVEGIRPVLASGTDAPTELPDVGDVRYELSRGVFLRIAERADHEPGRQYVLVIDEINRGNIARIFGELITLIEDSKRIGRDDEARVTLPISKKEFGAPANLHVVGTMNTADRSIALLDTALRRRFVFEEMMPDPSHSGISSDVDGVDCRKLLDAMNRRIAVLLDREHQMGHTYLLQIDTLAAIARTFQTRIVPLLQEYFYDDWEKIRAVLGDNGFVRKLDLPDDLVRLDLVDSSQAMYELLPANDERWTTPQAYREIYASETHSEDSGSVRHD